MDKSKKSITLNASTKRLLMELSQLIGIPENAVIAIAIHKLSKEIK